MSLNVTEEMVRHVARLSRLAISETEIPAFQEHFRKILAFVSELQSLDTARVDPSHFALEASNVYREDEVRPSLAVEEALANAPQSAAPYFLVPRVVGGTEDEDDLEGTGA